jgi:hypothetical protein
VDVLNFIAILEKAKVYFILFLNPMTRFLKRDSGAVENTIE